MQEAPRRPTDRNRTRTSLLRHVRDLGSQVEWNEFYDTYSDLIFFTARNAGLQPAEAEDLTQEVFIELTRRMPGFEYDHHQGSFRGWLLRLVSWRIKDRMRKRPVAANTTGPPGADAAEAPLEQVPDTVVERELEETWDKDWRRAVVRLALLNLRRNESLSERHLQILDLLVVRGLPPAEVAGRLGIKRALVDTTYSRIRKKLEQEIERLRDDPI